MEFLLYILGGVLLGVVLACVEAHFRGNTGTNKSSDFRQNEFDEEIEEFGEMFDDD